jgi:hypothetical protein
VLDDLNIPQLQHLREQGAILIDIAKIENELTDLKGAGNSDLKRRQDEMTQLDHQIHKLKKQADLARETAAGKRAADANLPLKERAVREHDRKMERFDIAEEGRKAAEKRYPKDSIQYKREMAFWDEFEQDNSI